MNEEQMKEESKSINSIIFNPHKAAKAAKESIEIRRNEKSGIPSYIPKVDNYLLPFKKGELIVFLGYTSNYKSGTMSYIARNVTEKYIKPNSNEIVIYCSWEQSIEEQTILDLSHASKIDASKLYQGDLNQLEWELLMKHAIDRATKPLWLIGHSEQSNSRRPRLSMSDIAQALAYIVDNHHKKPVLIILDYLQRINRDDMPRSSMREAFMSIVDRSKDMALAFGCPVFLGSQVSRDVLERKWKQPEISDGQETSNLEQSADKIFSCWLPKTSEDIGTMISKPGFQEEFEVTEDLLLLKLLKQKYGKAPITFGLKIQPQINNIVELDN